ncbi:MAG: DUF4388 domain-containing protein [Gemmatimonadetes bacterium]|nr:DUF4388 domain-containing protein [Gemmatimonadota bacterium]MBP7549489.1 DUF4388 domain-containing protein [Gemmatimonadaceae bacterium]
MAIEGPLQELGIHDVFQLLDLSRKTGTLTVVSELRDNEGTVLFENGKIVSANIRSNPHRLGDLLIRSGRLTDADMARAQAAQQRGDGRRLGEILVALGLVTRKEIERQVRLQIEAVVFELMSWREGHFRFQEGIDDGHWRDWTVAFPTESLLMEGARRIDEWSRIADRVPNLAMVPYLTPPDEDHPPLLDLLPSEWQVLSMIDGTHDLREIATTLAMSEFDVARITYGMVSTGVIRLRQSERISRQTPLPMEPKPVDARLTPVDMTVEPLRRGASAFRRGEFSEGIAVWSQFTKSVPQYPGIAAIREAIAAATTLRDILAREVPDVR